MFKRKDKKQTYCISFTIDLFADGMAQLSIEQLTTIVQEIRKHYDIEILRLVVNPAKKTSYLMFKATEDAAVNVQLEFGKECGRRIISLSMFKGARCRYVY